MQISLDRRSLVLATAAFVTAAGTGASAWTQSGDYPARPVTLIVPFPAGGPTDRHMRTLADIAGKHLGQPIIVENKPGAGGTLGPGTMARTAKPDGYTITQFPMSMLRMAHTRRPHCTPVSRSPRAHPASTAFITSSSVRPRWVWKPGWKRSST